MYVYRFVANCSSFVGAYLVATQVLAGEPNFSKTEDEVLIKSEQAGQTKTNMTLKSSDSVNDMARNEKLSSGKLILEAHLPRRTEVRINIDHMWTKHGHRAEPHEDGAREWAWMGAGLINGCETQTFELTAGEHDFYVSDDTFMGGPIKIVLSPGETQRFLLEIRHKGLKRLFHQMDLVSKGETPENSYYFLHRIPNK